MHHGSELGVLGRIDKLDILTRIIASILPLSWVVRMKYVKVSVCLSIVVNRQDCKPLVSSLTYTIPYALRRKKSHVS
jgi:hypothetical protein